MQIEGQGINFELETDNKRTLADMETDLSSAAEDGSFTAAWLILQSRLSSITTDHRADVRNGAVQTVFRIVDNSGERLSTDIWQFCLRSVILQVLNINIETHTRLAMNESSGSHDDKSLSGTTDTILKGLATVMTTHLDAITKLPDFEQVWQVILQHFSGYLAFHSAEISTYTFEALSQILAAAETAESLSVQSVNKTASLLEKSVPVSDHTPPITSGNEKALVAYVGTLKQIYRLISPRITDAQIDIITQNLQQCITSSPAQAYSTDVDSMTDLQNQAVSCIQMLRTDLANVPSSIIKCLASMVGLPYAPPTNVAGSRTLSFIALSKRAMELLQSTIIDNKSKDEIYNSGAVTTSLLSLSKSIEMKYKWEKQGKGPAMWRKATSAALVIVGNVLPAARSLDIDDETMADIWTQVVEIAIHISEADRTSHPPNDVLLSDETFDLESLASLRQYMTSTSPYPIDEDDTETVPLPRLGNPSIPDSIRRAYVAALCQTSLMHETSSVPEKSPTNNLYKLRAGRTYDPTFNPRIRMCYSCIDELFSLVHCHNSSPSQSNSPNPNTTTTYTYNLAQTAFPFLILRCALPLKRYIADQPLRGRMPTPTSQRLELLYILRKVQSLNCAVGQDVTVEGGAGDDGIRRLPVLDPQRRHLEWLVPLVNKAIGLARRDTEVAGELERVLELAYKMGRGMFGGD